MQNWKFQMIILLYKRPAKNNVIRTYSPNEKQTQNCVLHVSCVA